MFDDRAIKLIEEGKRTARLAAAAGVIVTADRSWPVFP